MRPILLCVLLAGGCASSPPLYSKDPWGWPITTWQARHGNVLAIECIPPQVIPDGIGMNDYVVSHGKKLPVFVEPPTRAILVAKHCARTSPAAASAPGVEPPAIAMIYTPSVEQLFGIHLGHHHARHAALHGSAHGPGHR